MWPLSTGEEAHLGKSKVTKLDVTVVVNEHIFGLQVTIHNVVVVEVIEGKYYAGHIESSELLIHALHAFTGSLAFKFKTFEMLHIAHGLLFVEKQLLSLMKTQVLSATHSKHFP